MKKYTVLALMAAICWIPAASQNSLPSRTLTIEGSYNPQATQAGKIMPVPEKPQIRRQQTKVSYLIQPNPNTTYQRQPMAVFGDRSDEVIPSAFQGLVRFGYGMRNLHDGLLDFDWRLSERDVIKVNGLMDGWSSKPDGDWLSRMFNAGIRASYSHRFDGFDIGIDGGYSHSNFNFKPGYLMDSTRLSKSDLMQKVNRADVGMTAKGRFGDVSWHAGLSWQWLMRNALVLNSVKGNDDSEKLLCAAAGFSLPFMEGIAGMEMKFRHLTYDWIASNGKKYINNSSLSVTPYWMKTFGDLDLNLGLNLNLHTKIGYPFLASPMITANYHVREHLSLLAGLTGGLIENDIRNLERISPYFSTDEQINDGYELVNVSVGAQYESGTWASLSGRLGYRRTIDEVFQVAYTGLLMTSEMKQQNSNVFYVNLNADMFFSDRAQLRFDFTYNNYMGKYPGFKMELKPAFDASLYSRVNLFEGLDAMLSYRLMVFNWIEGVAMPTVNDLALTLDYNLSKKMSIYVTGNKLAGGDFYYCSGYRALKPAVMAGITYRF